MNVEIGVGGFKPEYAHPEDAGIDLRSPIAVRIEPQHAVVIDTRVSVILPEGTCGLIVSKSELNINHGLTSTGLIDEGYIGHIKVRLFNDSDKPYVVKDGDKISQMVVLPVVHVNIQEVDSIYSPAARGEGGFGSTGR